MPSSHIIRGPVELATLITTGRASQITKEELATIAMTLLDYSDAKTGYEEKNARLNRLARTIPEQMERLHAVANQSHMLEEDKGKLRAIFTAVNEALYPTVGVARVVRVER